MVNIASNYACSLADIPSGGQARVLELAGDFETYERQRLVDLGIVPGTQVSVRNTSAMGGLRAYKLRGTVLGLRHAQASRIRVEAVA